jgi:hypothetical protein
MALKIPLHTVKQTFVAIFVFGETAGALFSTNKVTRSE